MASLAVRPWLALAIIGSSAALLGACSPSGGTTPNQGDAGVEKTRIQDDPPAAALTDINLNLSSERDASVAKAPTTDPGPSYAPPPDTQPPDVRPPEPRLTDFPADPVFADPSVPPEAPTMFAATPRATGTPCIISPEPNTLMPRNWLRPRFEFVPAADDNLFEIQLVVEDFAHALRVYTRQRTYTMGEALWSTLHTLLVDRPITVKVRGLATAANGKVRTPPSPAATTDFTIAPVEAPGKIVYWAIVTSSGTGVLRGFGIGEENVAPVLQSSQLAPPTVDKAKQEVCIGCHSATPDGLGVGFSMGPPYWYRNSMADITADNLGKKPSYVTNAQLAAVRKLYGVPAYSRGHWKDGDHIALLMDANQRGDLLWVNLDTDGEQGTIARLGDTKGAVLPAFSHDGTQIAYVSSNSIQDGRFGHGPSEIYVVPYNNRAGGTAKPVAGASDPRYTEYYPAYSSDDAYLAFARVAGNADSYSNKLSEVIVVPAGGGAALRVAANDPPTCRSAVVSPGVGNDWPKWAPDALKAANGRTYYWLTFSSTRSGRPQIYLAPMTVKDGQPSVNYPALYLWNQPTKENNHTPSWDNYQIPPVPPPPTPPEEPKPEPKPEPDASPPDPPPVVL